MFCKRVTPPRTITESRDQPQSSDKELPDDKVTMTVINDIANSIDSMIEMTYDVPSNYTDKKVPMLDVKTWINKDDNYKIYYIFMKSPQNALM